MWQSIVWFLTPIEPLTLEQFWDWRDFWLAKIFDDRFLVAWFLPLVPILLLFPRRHLRAGIILSSGVFIGYVFGLAHLTLWLLMAIGLYYFSEVYARECRRTDVLKIGPPLAAVAIILGVYVGTLVIRFVQLPRELNDWLLAHCPYLFPLGARGLVWEPTFTLFASIRERLGTMPLFSVALFDSHTIGTAYLLVRMLHYFAELKRDTIPAQRRSLTNFLAYVCYAPAIIQGPIERYPVFQDELDTCHTRRSWRAVPPALARIGLGVVKSLVAQVYLRPLMFYKMGLGLPGGKSNYFTNPESIETLWLYLGLFLPILWIYVEFSGYCDISAGIARLLGYRQVENFNLPWIATSLRDFWRRWHISLSFVLRDYIYIPLGGNKRHTTLNLCLTFFICGIWHPTLVTAGAWGILMGLMIAANQWWVDWMKRVDAAPASALASVRRAVFKLGPAPQVLGWLVTQHAFVWSLLLFSGGDAIVRVTVELFRRLILIG